MVMVRQIGGRMIDTAETQFVRLPDSIQETIRTSPQQGISMPGGDTFTPSGEKQGKKGTLATLLGTVVAGALLFKKFHWLAKGIKWLRGLKPGSIRQLINSVKPRQIAGRLRGNPLVKRLMESRVVQNEKFLGVANRIPVVKELFKNVQLKLF